MRVGLEEGREMGVLSSRLVRKESLWLYKTATDNAKISSLGDTLGEGERE